MIRLRVAALVGVALSLVVPATAGAVAIVGVTESGTPQKVSVFDSGAPATLTYGPTSVSGIGATERIVGIDYRPATGELYAVTRDTVSTSGRLYALEPLSGVLTQIGAGDLPMLAGTTFGVDFDPLSDELDLVSDANEHLRVHPTLMGLSGGTLAYGIADPNAGADPNIVASAFTDNVPGAVSTTLYDIDSTLNLLVTQSNGTLTTIASLPNDIDPPLGFDISEAGTAFASVSIPGTPDYSTLATVNLATGALTVIDNIGTSATNTPGRYSGLAVAPPSYYLVADAEAAEDAGNALVTVTRRSPFGTAMLGFVTLPGTAAAGSDYDVTSGSLSWTNGERTKTISVPIVDDASDETATDETFTVRLTAATAGGRIVDADARVAIVDNDAPGQPSPSPSPPPVAPEDKPPTVALTAPAANATLSALRPATVTAAASDDFGVARVVFYRGARALGTDTTAPYSVTYAPAVADIGAGTLVAVAFDTAGQSASSLADVRVARFAPTLRVATTPRRDTSDPRRFTTSGTVGLPVGADKAAACSGGRVTVRFRAGKTTISSRTVRLTATCTYRSRVSFKQPRRFSRRARLDVRAVFHGTAALTARTAATSVRVR